MPRLPVAVLDTDTVVLPYDVVSPHSKDTWTVLALPIEVSFAFRMAEVVVMLVASSVVTARGDVLVAKV